MNFNEAKVILELPDNFTPEELKKQYHKLAKFYHPDKNKEINSDIFIKINEAYNFLNKKNYKINEFNSFNQFNPFNPFNFFSFNIDSFNHSFKFNSEIKLTITVNEYLLGTKKYINIKENCNCEKKLCKTCVGTGYSINKLKILSSKELDICMHCLGDGFLQECQNCKNGKKENKIFIDIPPMTLKLNFKQTTINIKLEEPYFIKNEKIYFTMDISLKESLTGFIKIFKDPFGVEHIISINKIVKSNDGIKLNKITIVFNVIYPIKLSEAVIMELNKINF